MKRLIPLITLLLFASETATATEDGGTLSPFSLGAGARELALGGSNLANIDPATAPFWNASRLARAERFSFSGFHTRLYESGIGYQYLGLALPTLDMGGFGIGVFRQYVDGIEKRDVNNLYLGDIEDNQFRLNLAYGGSVWNYNIGLATSIEHHSLDGFSATSSPGLSLSLSRRHELKPAWLRDFAFAINGRNIIKPGIELADEKFDYPFSFEAGISLTVVPGRRWGHTASVSASVTKADFVDAVPAIGLEYSHTGRFHVRAGMRGTRLSAGIGLSIEPVSFDYAIVDRDLGSVHMFTLSTALGKSVRERKKSRAQRREAEFDFLMNQRLTARNRKLIDELVTRGEEQLKDGKFEDAHNSFDRALFMARSIGADTVRIRDLAVGARSEFVRITREIRFTAFLDSALTKFDDKDYLSARHFASLALSETPESREANRVLVDATDAIEKNIMKEELIQNQLKRVDSLVNHGLIGQASQLLVSLHDLTPEHSGISLALARVETERWREIAFAAYAEGDFQAALMAIDSVQNPPPGQSWHTRLAANIEKAMTPARLDSAVSAATEQPEPLSAELRKEVETAYSSAQHEFEKGNLTSAISHWEKVEDLAPDFLSVRQYLVSAYKFIGVELYGKKQRQDAVAVWKKAMLLDKDNAEISEYIRRTENELRRLQELSYDR